MSWVRWGDNSHDHPILANVMEHELFDDRLLNEVHGFISRCASSSGSHTTDYLIKHGTAVQIAGPSRVHALVEVAIFAGYMSEVETDGPFRVYKLVDDDPNFLHLRLKAELDFEKQRKADHSNPALIIPVRLRDGDACRWCGRVVNWNDRKSARAGTYDHLVPGEGASIETSVVACKGCNSARGDASNWTEELRPVPAEPYFSKLTVDWIKTNQWAQKNGYEPPARSRKVVTPGDLAPHASKGHTTSLSPATAASSAPAGERPGNQPENAGMPDLTDAPAPRPDIQSANAPSKPRTGTQSEHASKPDTTSEKPKSDGNQQIPLDGQSSGSVSPGRAGSGRVGPGRVGSPDQPTTPSYPNSELNHAPRSSRGRRKRRSRKPSHRKPSVPPTTGDSQ